MNPMTPRGLGLQTVLSVKRSISRMERIYMSRLYSVGTVTGWLHRIALGGVSYYPYLTLNTGDGRCSEFELIMDGMEFDGLSVLSTAPHADRQQVILRPRSTSRRKVERWGALGTEPQIEKYYW